MSVVTTAERVSADDVRTHLVRQIDSQVLSLPDHRGPGRYVDANRDCLQGLIATIAANPGHLEHNLTELINRAVLAKLDTEVTA